MDEVTVRVEADVKPTEDEAKVKTAVAKLFGDLPTVTERSSFGGVLTAEAKGREALENLRNLLRRDRVRSAARRVLFKSQRGKTIDFCLNKQVAFAGHVSFSQEAGESPLGPIRVMIECENPRELIDWLAPRTQ
jgi:predicted RNA binding protein with dsRBD fold (UPF0201 family)